MSIEALSPVMESRVYDGAREAAVRAIGNAANGDGIAKCGFAYIAGLGRIGLRSVQRALDTLAADGAITILDRRLGRGKVNRYQIAMQRFEAARTAAIAARRETFADDGAGMEAEMRAAIAGYSAFFPDRVDVALAAHEAALRAAWDNPKMTEQRAREAAHAAAVRVFNMPPWVEEAAEQARAAALAEGAAPAKADTAARKAELDARRAGRPPGWGEKPVTESTFSEDESRTPCPPFDPESRSLSPPFPCGQSEKVDSGVQKPDSESDPLRTLSPITLSTVLNPSRAREAEGARPLEDSDPPAGPDSPSGGRADGAAPPPLFDPRPITDGERDALSQLLGEKTVATWLGRAVWDGTTLRTPATAPAAVVTQVCGKALAAVLGEGQPIRIEAKRKAG